MWGFLKRHAIICASAAAVCVLAAATLSTSPEDGQSDLKPFGQSGSRNFTPPDSYRVTGAESVYDIADKLKIPFYDLVIENRLTGESPLVDGTVLRVPRYIPAASWNARPDGARGVAFEELGGTALAIHADTVSGTAPLTVQFSARSDLAQLGVRFVWDFGNNRFSFDTSPRALYVHPGVYDAKLVTVDGAGRYALSESMHISVGDVRADYDGLPYITLDRIGDFVSTQGRVTDADGLAVNFDAETVMTQDPPLLKYLRPNAFIATAGGFSKVDLKKGPYEWTFYLFVSPFPSRLSTEPEYDWYKTQFDTGMYGNCGPSANASAIKWAVGEDLTVPEVRGEIGMPYANGAVDYDNLTRNLHAHSVPAKILPIGTAKDITDVIDAGGIVIVGFNCGSVAPSKGDKRTNFVGRYYPDATGHYLLIKGYTLDDTMFVVYDAIPGDWKKNELRYADGVSMIGRNRFFKIDEVMKTIRGMQMIAVWRDADQMSQ